MKPISIGRSSTQSTAAASRAGFSLAEIMVVILIIGLLAGYVAPKLLSKVDAAKVQSAKQQMATLKDQVVAYRMERSEWPDELEQLTEENERGQSYMDKIPTDPWNNPYAMEIEGGDVTIWCYGADGQPGGTGEDSDFSTGDDQD